MLLITLTVSTGDNHYCLFMKDFHKLMLMYEQASTKPREWYVVHCTTPFVEEYLFDGTQTGRNARRWTVRRIQKTLMIID